MTAPLDLVAVCGACWDGGESKLIGTRPTDTCAYCGGVFVEGADWYAVYPPTFQGVPVVMAANLGAGNQATAPLDLDDLERRAHMDTECFDCGAPAVTTDEVAALVAEVRRLRAAEADRQITAEKLEQALWEDPMQPVVVPMSIAELESQKAGVWSSTVPEPNEQSS